MSGEEDSVQDRPARYANEDTSPTTERELRGWYSYGIAAEVFAVAGVGAWSCAIYNPALGLIGRRLVPSCDT